MNIYLALVLGVMFYFLVPFFIVVFVKNAKVKNVLITIMFISFLVALFIGIYFKVSITNNKVLVTPDFSGNWCSKKINFSFSNITRFDFLINIVMLIPIGMLTIYLMQRKKLWQKILVLCLVAFVSGILTELGQFILPIPRSVQLSDSILNIISVVMGGLIMSVYIKFKNIIFKEK